MRKTHLVWIAVAVAFTVILVQAGSAQPVVKVGNILPLSGPSASVGLQNKQAQDMAVDEINQAGGIKSLGGAKIQLLYADSESKPEKGVAEAERFINTEKVNILTGCWNSAVSYPVSAVAERYSIPFLVPVSVADKITEQGFKNVFRIAAKDSWWTRDQFAFLKDMEKEFNVKIGSVAFVYENGDWGKGFAEGWKKLAQAGGYKVVLDEPYPSTATDLSPVVQKIKRANPDVLFLTSNAADAILLTNTMAEYKVKPKAIIASGGGHADPSFLKAAGKNARYLFDIVEWETDVNKPGADKTNEKFKNGRPRAGEVDRPQGHPGRTGEDQAHHRPGHDRGLRHDRVRRCRPEQARGARDDPGQRHRQGHGADHGLAEGLAPGELQAGLPYSVGKSVGCSVLSVRSGGGRFRMPGPLPGLFPLPVLA